MNIKYLVCVVLIMLFVYYVLNKEKLDGYIQGAMKENYSQHSKESNKSKSKC